MSKKDQVAAVLKALRDFQPGDEVWIKLDIFDVRNRALGERVGQRVKGTIASKKDSDGWYYVTVYEADQNDYDFEGKQLTYR